MSRQSRPAPPSKLEIGYFWECRPIPGSDYEPVIDAGELNCFACQKMDRATANWPGAQGALERAHVVPFSLGGSNDVSNYVMLCSACHREAPDVKNPKYMWRWIAAHPRDGGLAGLVTAAHRALDEMRSLGIDPNEFMEAFMNASDARKQAVAEQVSVHFDNHGRWSTGTKGAYAAEFMQTPEPGESASDVGNAA